MSNIQYKIGGREAQSTTGPHEAMAVYQERQAIYVERWAVVWADLVVVICGGVVIVIAEQERCLSCLESNNTT